MKELYKLNIESELNSRRQIEAKKDLFNTPNDRNLHAIRLKKKQELEQEKQKLLNTFSIFDSNKDVQPPRKKQVKKKYKRKLRMLRMRYELEELSGETLREYKDDLRKKLEEECRSIETFQKTKRR